MPQAPCARHPTHTTTGKLGTAGQAPIALYSGDFRQISRPIILESGDKSAKMAELTAKTGMIPYNYKKHNKTVGHINEKGYGQYIRNSQ